MNGALSPAQPLGFVKLLAHDLRWNMITALARSDHRVQELMWLLDQPANLVSYHLKQLRDQQLVRERRSSADGRDIYYSLNLDTLRDRYDAVGEALHPALAETSATSRTQDPQSLPRPVRVLFLCTENSARSQMAEGILRHLGGDRVEAFSAGGNPSSIHPNAVSALAEIGIDISHQHSKHLEEFRDQPFDYIITVCDRVREVCPTFPDDSERIHWSLPDPLVEGATEAQSRAFKRTAHELVTRIRYLLTLIDREKGKAT